MSKQVTKLPAAAVIFDLDGVLIDSGKDIANAINFTLRSFGLPERPAAEIISFIGPGVDGIVRRSLGDKADELFEKALPVYKKRYGENCTVETALYPGVAETLAKLKASGKRMAVCTNKLEVFTRRILEALKVAEYFEAIVGPESVTHRKPDPEAINVALKKLAVAAQDSIVVGDARSDIEAAQRAGAHSCGVTYGVGKPAEIEGAHPDFVINKADELPACIQ